MHKYILTFAMASLTACTPSPPPDPSAGSLFPQPETARGPVLPQDKGYLVEEIRDGVYWLTNGHYHVMFVTTGEGVIVVDAPRNLVNLIRPAIAEITDEPITHLI